MRTCNVPAPIMPAVWPVKQKEEKPVKRRFPNTMDEPMIVGYYLKPIIGICSHPDREKILREYLREFII